MLSYPRIFKSARSLETLLQAEVTATSILPGSDSKKRHISLHISLPTSSQFEFTWEKLIPDDAEIIAP